MRERETDAAVSEVREQLASAHAIDAEQAMLAGENADHWAPASRRWAG
ncbi:MAG: hypothetical protein R3C16_13935 [Hyphomonadaceae bacterium]